MQGQLSSPRSEPAPTKEDVLLVVKALVGARIRQSASDRNPIACIGSSESRKSTLLLAFPLLQQQ